MENTGKLTAHSHAYLFGVIAHEVIVKFGEAGKQVIAEGVTRYGRQRGRRMAERTLTDGLELSELNYVAYGEWAAEPGDIDVSIPAKNPDIQFLIKKCPWHDTWSRYGLLENYGYLYCKYIDVALAESYNPALRFDILENRGLGDAVCDMRLRSANVTDEEEAEFVRRVEQLGTKAKMSWDYHCAHLFKTLWEEVVAQFGQAGYETMLKALKDFQVVHGRAATDRLLQGMNTDFDVTPPYAGIGG